MNEPDEQFEQAETVPPVRPGRSLPLARSSWIMIVAALGVPVYHLLRLPRGDQFAAGAATGMAVYTVIFLLVCYGVAWTAYRIGNRSARIANLVFCVLVAVMILALVTTPTAR